MNRQEALAIIHEILGALSESVLICGVSLDPLSSQVSKDPDNDGYLIRIRSDLDNYSEERLNPLFEKHNLTMKEENGYVVIAPIL